MGLYFLVDTNECANLQGGVSDYNCTCVTGWEGQNCDINTDDCTPDPCENGATCNVRTQLPLYMLMQTFVRTI